MTEDEAKTKWCPFARATGVEAGEPSWNRIARGEGLDLRNALCIGSACMAWRTRTMRQEVRAAMFRDERRLHPDLSDGDLWGRINSYDHPDGFCGLAGAPQ